MYRPYDSGKMFQEICVPSADETTGCVWMCGCVSGVCVCVCVCDAAGFGFGGFFLGGGCPLFDHLGLAFQSLFCRATTHGAKRMITVF